MKKKKLGVSNTAYDGGWCVTDGDWWLTDGGWWVTDGGWWVTDGGWCVTDGGWWVTDVGWCVTDGGWWVTDGGWWVTDGGWWVTDGGWWVTDGGWWVATKHQRVDAIVKKKGGERPYGTPCVEEEGKETVSQGLGPFTSGPRVNAPGRKTEHRESPSVFGLCFSPLVCDLRLLVRGRANPRLPCCTPLRVSTQRRGCIVPTQNVRAIYSPVLRIAAAHLSQLLRFSTTAQKPMQRVV